MIAATYTPFAANRLAPPAGTIILAAIWLCASFGIGMKLLFPRRFEFAEPGALHRHGVDDRDRDEAAGTHRWRRSISGC